MNKKIVRRSYDPIAAVQLTGLHPLLQRLYAARQVHDLQAINCDTEHLLPFHALLNIDAAVQLLAEALVKNLRILIVGDFDADGATSTALAVRALKLFGAECVDFLVPNRFAYGYGLTEGLVEEATTLSPDLIVTVDNGIANHAGVLLAKSRGIKVLVTDHHLPAATLPLADVIVNPNQPHDSFPSKHLAGVGVIFYVMLALRRHLTQQGWFAKKQLPEPKMATLLDLVALGTVADLVPLDRNNRILVHQGLRRIRAGCCVPGIRALFELSGRDMSQASTTDLAFIVAARLNAAGRLDDMSLGIHCLLAEEGDVAREKARVLNQLNNERRAIEREMQVHALNLLDKMHFDRGGTLPKGLCLYDASWHQGVIGILAARIKDRLHRPVLVFANGHDDELKGSARSIAGLHIRDVLASIATQHPTLINKFGGHAMAAGLTIRQQDFETFARIFNEVVSAQLDEETLEPIYITDGTLTTDELTLEVASLLRDAGPWGQTFPEPLFDDVFQILEQRIVGDKHLKLRLAKDNKVLEAMMFFADTDLWPNHRCQFVQAVYRLERNEYKGRYSVQLIVDQLVPAEAIGQEATAGERELCMS